MSKIEQAHSLCIMSHDTRRTLRRTYIVQFYISLSIYLDAI